MKKQAEEWMKFAKIEEFIKEAESIYNEIEKRIKN